MSKTLFAINPLSTNFTKLPITLKQFIGKLPTNCLSVFGHFVKLVLKGLIAKSVLDIRKQRNLVYWLIKFRKISEE